MKDIWTFLQDESNRAVLGWIGSGIVAVVGGVWVGFKFFLTKARKQSQSAPQISAAKGGVIAGRDIRDTKIDIRG